MFIFPAHILPPKNIVRSIERQTLSGGVALSGAEDTILADGGGRWVVEYQGIALPSARETRVWEAWLEYLAGGLNECLVPLLSFATSPRSYVGRRPKPPSRLYVDDDEWPTAMRYSVAEHEAEMPLGAPLRATTVAIAATKGGAPQSGQIFSVGQNAYRIVRPTGGLNVYSVAPPLRLSVAVGASVVFDFPLLKMRADPKQEFAVPLFRSQSGEAAIRFVESV